MGPEELSQALGVLAYRTGKVREAHAAWSAEQDKLEDLLRRLNSRHIEPELLVAVTGLTPEVVEEITRA